MRDLLLEAAEFVLRNGGMDDELSPDVEARFGQVSAVYDAIEEETGMDYRYQLPSIRHLSRVIAREGSGLDASDCGVGKTPVACGVAKVLARSLFVVCPKSVIAPWKRIAALFDVPIEVINYEALRTGKYDAARAWEEVFYTDSGQKRRKRHFQWNPILNPATTLIVFDDCHKMKDYKTWNCLMGVQALTQGYRVLAGSGTAADNPMQMKFVALLTGLIEDPNHFFGWMLEHGVTRAPVYGYSKQGKPRGPRVLKFTGGREILAGIHRQIFPARGYRIRIADLGDRFPQTSISVEAYDMGAQATEEIQAVYAEMRREIAKLEATRAKDRSRNIFTEQLRARQRAELLKVPTLIDMAEDALEQGMSVVLFLNFDDSINAIKQRAALGKLGREVQRLMTAGEPTITGRDTPRQRQDLIDRFNADEVPLVIANIKAGGTGVSLQGTATGRHRLGLHSPTFSAIDFRQALFRLPRAGGAPSVQKVVFAAGTPEEPACVKVRRKLARIDTLNDGDLAVP